MAFEPCTCDKFEYSQPHFHVDADTMIHWDMLRKSFRDYEARERKDAHNEERAINLVDFQTFAEDAGRRNSFLPPGQQRAPVEPPQPQRRGVGRIPPNPPEI